MNSPLTKEVLTTGEVARLCHVTIRTVIKWFEKGHLKGYKIPGSRDRRFARADVLQFMKDNGIPLAERDSDPTARRRILIVDDEEAVVALLEEYLRQIGIFDWQVARNGYEAGLKTRAFRPHLLLTDYNLGDLTGADVAESVRSDPDLSGLKIVVFSGFVSDSEAVQLKARGVDEFLRKPFTFEQLRDTILRLLKVGV